MKLIEKNIDINVENDFAFTNLYKNEVYKQWGSEFSEGSEFIGKIVEGSDVIFTDGTSYNLPAKVDRLIMNKLISFEIVHEYETYEFEKINNKTKLTVKLNASDEEYPALNEMWDRAILKIKEVLETKALDSKS